MPSRRKIEGLAYLREIVERQAAFVRSPPGSLPVPSDGGQEILGYRLGAALLEQLAGIGAGRLGRCLTAKRVLLLEDRAVHVDEAARQSRAAGCASFEAHC